MNYALQVESIPAPSKQFTKQVRTDASQPNDHIICKPDIAAMGWVDAEQSQHQEANEQAQRLL